MMQSQPQQYDPRTTVFVLPDIWEYCKSVQVQVDAYCMQVEPALQHMQVGQYVKFNPQNDSHIVAVKQGAALIGSTEFQRATISQTPHMSEEEIDGLNWGGDSQPIDWQKFGIATRDYGKSKTINFLKGMGIGYTENQKEAMMDADDLLARRMRQLAARQKQRRGF